MTPTRPAAALAAAFAAALAVAAGCQTAEPPGDGHGAAICDLGQSYKSSQGDVYLIRVQDEYRLIRCIPTGPIAGCYEDVFRIERATITDDVSTKTGVRWNEWVPVPQVSGLEICFLTPNRVAYREKFPSTEPR